MAFALCVKSHEIDDSRGLVRRARFIRDTILAAVCAEVIVLIPGLFVLLTEATPDFPVQSERRIKKRKKKRVDKTLVGGAKVFFFNKRLFGNIFRLIDFCKLDVQQIEEVHRSL